MYATFPARTTGAKWNGFAVPWFDKATADAIVEAFNRAGGQRGTTVARYDEERDAYVFRDEEMDPPDEWFEGESFGSERLYPIGAYSWTWTKVDEPSSGKKSTPSQGAGQS